MAGWDKHNESVDVRRNEVLDEGGPAEPWSHSCSALNIFVRAATFRRLPEIHSKREFREGENPINIQEPSPKLRVLLFSLQSIKPNTKIILMMKRTSKITELDLQ